MPMKWNMTKEKGICVCCPQQEAHAEGFKLRQTVTGSTEAFPVLLSNMYLIAKYDCGLEKYKKKDNETYTMGAKT